MYDEKNVKYLDCINNVAHGKWFIITTIILIGFCKQTALISSWPLSSACRQ